MAIFAGCPAAETCLPPEADTPTPNTAAPQTSKTETAPATIAIRTFSERDFIDPLFPYFRPTMNCSIV